MLERASPFEEGAICPLEKTETAPVACAFPLRTMRD